MKLGHVTDKEAEATIGVKDGHQSDQSKFGECCFPSLFSDPASDNIIVVTIVIGRKMDVRKAP